MNQDIAVRILLTTSAMITASHGVMIMFIWKKTNKTFLGYVSMLLLFLAGILIGQVIML